MKQILLFSIFLVSTVCGLAQTTEITGYKLSDLTDIIKIEGNNVNLRKAPSAKAPRLVRLVGGEYDYVFDCGWSDEVKGTTEPVYGDSFYPSVQLDRNHDFGKYDDIPDGTEFWIKLAYNAAGVYYPVWVKRNFCNIMPASNIYADRYYANNYQKYQLSIRKDGIYEGLCLYQAKIENENDPEGLFLGMLVDGQVVLPLRFKNKLISVFNQDEDVQGIEVCDGYIRYNPSYEGNAEYEGGGFMTLDMDRLSDDDISNILSQCEYATEQEQMILLGNTFDGGFFRVTVPTDGTSFFGLPVEKVSVKYDKATPRVINNPSHSYINPGTRLERVLVQPNGTTLEMSFVNTSGLRQWNVNCDAYITCDATPGKKFRLLHTRGVNISPKPTNVSGNRNERISFSMTFEPIPLHAKTLTLVEGPSRDNFHANDVDISEKKNTNPKSADAKRVNTSDTSNSKSILDDLIVEPEPQGNGKVYENAEIAPSFPGGVGAMMSWIGKNMKYPDGALNNNIQGKVMVRFVVLSNGGIGEIHIYKSVEPSLDNEAVRLVKAMPKWNPGTANGKPVNVWYTLPVTFKLN